MKLKVTFFILIYVEYFLYTYCATNNKKFISCPNIDNEFQCSAVVFANDSQIDYEYHINGSSKVKIFELNDSNVYKLTPVICNEYPSIEQFSALNTYVHVIEPETFNKCKNLIYLDLSLNRLSIPLNETLFETNKKLKKIMLQENGITDLDPRLFSGLEELEVLKLHSNNLSQLNFEKFPMLPSLKQLYLHGNPLWYLDVEAMVSKFPNLTYVSVFSESLNKYGKQCQISCGNSQHLRDTFSSRNITIDFQKEHKCPKFDNWYEKCRRDTKCSDILMDIVKSKVSGQTIYDRDSNFKLECNNTNNDYTNKLNSYEFSTFIIISVISIFVGTTVCSMIMCLNNKKLKKMKANWTSNTLYHSDNANIRMRNMDNINPVSVTNTNQNNIANSHATTNSTELAFSNENNQIPLINNNGYPREFFIDPAKKEKVIKQNEIGSGSFGKVCRGVLKNKTGEQPVAIKYINTADQPLTQISSEITTMQNLHHPNIVRFLSYITVDKYHIIVMEYMAKGSLINHLQEKKKNGFYGKNSEYINLLDLAKDIALGLEYLFKENIVHCDLAARNILISEDGHAKISDFGLARFCNSNEYYLNRNLKPAPLKWYSPEAMESGKYTKMSDIWSYGVTLFELFSLGDKPYKEVPHIEMLPEFVKANVLKKPEICPDNIYNELMKPCWNLEPKQRPQISVIIDTINKLKKPYKVNNIKPGEYDRKA